MPRMRDYDETETPTPLLRDMGATEKVMKDLYTDETPKFQSQRLYIDQIDDVSSRSSNV